MKSIVFITAYAPTKEKQELLFNCIKSVKALNMDIVVASHASIPEYILREVDYFIYDKDNRFNLSGGTSIWKNAYNIHVERYALYSHQFPIVQLIRSILYLAKGYEYDFFFGTDFDNIFSEEDIQKLINLKEQMILENKKFIFFYPPDASWEINNVKLFGKYYDLYVVGGYVNDFLKIFDNYFPKSLDAYNEFVCKTMINKPQCFEYYFYDAFHRYKDDTLIIEEYVEDYLKSSSINNSGLLNTFSMILPSTNDSHCLYVNNDNINKYRFKVYFDNKLKYEFNLMGFPIANSFKVIPIYSESHIRVEVYDDTVLIDTHDMTYKKEYSEKYATLGKITIS